MLNEDEFLKKKKCQVSHTLLRYRPLPDMQLPYFLLEKEPKYVPTKSFLISSLLIITPAVHKTEY